MGDAADAQFDDEFDAWAMHMAGDCDDYCQYCAEAEDEVLATLNQEVE